MATDQTPIAGLFHFRGNIGDKTIVLVEITLALLGIGALGAKALVVLEIQPRMLAIVEAQGDCCY